MITSHPIGSGRSLFPENERHTFLENAIERGSRMDRLQKRRAARAAAYELAEFLTLAADRHCDFEREKAAAEEAERELERIAAFMGFTITRQSEQRGVAA